MAKKGDDTAQETALEREQAGNARRMRDDWERRWKPVEDQWIADMRDNEPEKAQALGIANLETTKAFDAVHKQTAQANAAAGAGPGSSRFALSLADAGDAESMASGRNAADTASNAEDMRLSGLHAVTNLGRGQQADAVAGLDQLASESQETAMSEAAADRSNRVALGNAAFQLAGMGASARTPAAGAEAAAKNAGVGLEQVSAGGKPMINNSLPTADEFLRTLR